MKEWKEGIPSGRRRPRELVKGGKGALFTSTGSLTQFPEIIKKFSLLKPIKRAMALYQTKMRAPRQELVKTNRLTYL